MSQQEIEVILARHLAEYLALPMFIVDPDGNLVYYNDAAGSVLGYNYDETGPMPASEWATLFQPVDQKGRPLKAEELPLVMVTMKHHPAHRGFWIRGMDGATRYIEVTAFPLIVQGQRFLGAIAVFWEVPQ